MCGLNTEGNRLVIIMIEIVGYDAAVLHLSLH